MLVYLDTSNIHFLSKLRQQDGPRFSAFLDKWRRHNCALALSGVHLLELRRYGDAPARESRYQLLEELCPVRCQIEPVHRLEIARCLNRLGEKFAPEVSGGPQSQAFPLYLNTPDEVSEVRGFEDAGLGLFFEAFYDASKAGAAAHSREQDSKYERRRMSQIGDAKPSAEHRATFLEAWEKERIPTSELESLSKLVPPDVLDTMFDAFRDLGLKFLDRAGEVGGVNAYAEALGLDQDDPSVRRSYTDQLSQDYAFRFSVREVAQSLGARDESLLTEASEIVRTEDCPGTWLRNAAEIRLRKATAKDEPSNLFDLSHLGHLPYVDLLFTDKRIAEFARQVLSSADLPPSVQGIREPVAVPDSIDALESALFSGGNVGPPHATNAN